MKLTKGKISKLYNKHKQSCRRKKICKRRKNNQSFRKSKPLNLATKTLNMKGGANGLFTRTPKAAATKVASTGAKKIEYPIEPLVKMIEEMKIVEENQDKRENAANAAAIEKLKKHRVTVTNEVEGVQWNLFKDFSDIFDDLKALSNPTPPTPRVAPLTAENLAQLNSQTSTTEGSVDGSAISDSTPRSGSNVGTPRSESTNISTIGRSDSTIMVGGGRKKDEIYADYNKMLNAYGENMNQLEFNRAKKALDEIKGLNVPYTKAFNRILSIISKKIKTYGQLNSAELLTKNGILANEMFKKIYEEMDSEENKKAVQSDIKLFFADKIDPILKSGALKTQPKDLETIAEKFKKIKSLLLPSYQYIFGVSICRIQQLLNEVGVKTDIKELCESIVIPTSSKSSIGTSTSTSSVVGSDSGRSVSERRDFGPTDNVSRDIDGLKKTVQALSEKLEARFRKYDVDDSVREGKNDESTLDSLIRSVQGVAVSNAGLKTQQVELQKQLDDLKNQREQTPIPEVKAGIDEKMKALQAELEQTKAEMKQNIDAAVKLEQERAAAAAAKAAEDLQAAKEASEAAQKDAETAKAATLKATEDATNAANEAAKAKTALELKEKEHNDFKVTTEESKRNIDEEINKLKLDKEAADVKLAAAVADAAAQTEKAQNDAEQATAAADKVVADMKAKVERDTAALSQKEADAAQLLQQATEMAEKLQEEKVAFDKSTQEERLKIQQEIEELSRQKADLDTKKIEAEAAKTAAAEILAMTQAQIDSANEAAKRAEEQAAAKIKAAELDAARIVSNAEEAKRNIELELVGLQETQSAVQADLDNKKKELSDAQNAAKAAKQAELKQKQAAEQAAAEEKRLKEEALAARENERLKAVGLAAVAAEEQQRKEEALKKNEEQQLKVEQPEIDVANGTSSDIINKMIRVAGGGDINANSPVKVTSEPTDFCYGVQEDVYPVFKLEPYKGGKYDDVTQLKQQIQDYINIVNKVIYKSPVLVMLNSLRSIDELTQYTVDPKIQEYMKQFFEFALIDVGMFKQISESQNSHELTFGDTKFTDIDQANYDAIKKVSDAIYPPLLRIVEERVSESSVVFESRRAFMEKNIDIDGSVFVHILELSSVFDSINKIDILENEVNQRPGLVEIIYALIFARLNKLNAFITSANGLTDKANLLAFKSKLSNMVDERNSVISYLSLNNKRGGDEYNRNRFGLNTDTDFTYLQLKYNDDNKKSIAPQNPGDYSNTYMFGKFNKIFGIKNDKTKNFITNLDIAKNMTAVKNSLLEGKPVFIIGYGQSGAGKTSSLIYLNPPSGSIPENEKPGVLIHLCNMFAQSPKKYKTIILTTQEFFKTKNQSIGDCSNLDSSDNKCTPQTFRFDYDETKQNFFYKSGDLHTKFGWKLSEPAENYLQIMNGLQAGNQEKLERLAEKFKDNLKPGKSTKSKLVAYSKVLEDVIKNRGESLPLRSFDVDVTSMGQAIIHLIDKDRFVKPTTNNRVSSRSHSLVYIKLISEEKDAVPLHLIIGDFAGVENKYDCLDEGVAKDFLYLKDGKQYAYIPRPSRVEPPQPISNFTVKNVKSVLTGGTKRHGNKRNNRSKKVHQKGGAGTDIKTLNLWAKEAKDYWDREKSNALKDKKAIPLETNHKLNHSNSLNVVGNNKGVIIDFINGIKEYNVLKQFIGPTNVVNDQFRFLDHADETDGINTTFREKLKSLKKVMTKQELLNYGTQICDERVSEGEFINQTLSDLRNTINDITRIKNSKTIYYSPAFHSECLDDLCPSSGSCFTFQKKDKSRTTSFIMQWIYNIYKTPPGILDVSKNKGEPLADRDFCDKLTIGLFCVLDISITANNPPPVPYIDINDMKKLWNNMKITNYGVKPDEIQNDFEKMSKLATTLKGSLDKYEIPVTEPSLLVDESLINDQVTYKLSNVEKYIEKLLRAPIFTYISGSISIDYKKSVETFIEQIDKHNSVTALGTLEYLDSFSKLYLTNTLCVKPGDQNFTNVTVDIVNQNL